MMKMVAELVEVRINKSYLKIHFKIMTEKIIFNQRYLRSIIAVSKYKTISYY
jgi:hypothetical protein